MNKYPKLIYAENLKVNGPTGTKNAMDSLIKPYEDTLKSIMSEVIAFNENALEKNAANGELHNWIADALYNQYKKNFTINKPTLALLNHGGIRSNLPKGNVNLGDFYHLMPFDNAVVYVEIPIENQNRIIEYLKKKGGAISNVKLNHNKLIFNDSLGDSKSIFVITSDYLLDGGEGNNIFENHISVKESFILLRDLLILEARSQQKLIINPEKRIQP